MKILIPLIVLFLIFGCKRRPVNNTNHSNAKTEVKESNQASKPKSRIVIPQNPTENQPKIVTGSNSVKMTKRGGVYEIPISINGYPMDFIFDTGASSISISETEVFFLYKQGRRTEDDIKGEVEFIDATGGISQGTLINLREVKIGNRELYNVEASVVHNMEAPLLLGQSALAQFGKLTIDYKNNEIIFE